MRLFTPPHPITVRLSPATQRPTRFVWQGITHTVERIISDIEVYTSWWDSDYAHRQYLTLTTTSGLLVVVYKDMLTEAWLLQKIYD